jgi:hypothetical protein
MNEWQGLHNPERHEVVWVTKRHQRIRCRECDGYFCYPESPCRCCLAAEVESLRAQVEQYRAEVIRVTHPGATFLFGDVCEEVEALEEGQS